MFMLVLFRTDNFELAIPQVAVHCQYFAYISFDFCEASNCPVFGGEGVVEMHGRILLELCRPRNKSIRIMRG